MQLTLGGLGLSKILLELVNTGLISIRGETERFTVFVGVPLFIANAVVFFAYHTDYDIIILNDATGNVETHFIYLMPRCVNRRRIGGDHWNTVLYYFLNNNSWLSTSDDWFFLLFGLNCHVCYNCCRWRVRRLNCSNCIRSRRNDSHLLR